MSECSKCRDFRRAYGFAMDDLRAAARKLVRSGGAEKYAIEVRHAKFQKAEVARLLNEHAATHPEKESTA